MTEEKYNELRLKFLAFRDEYEALCKKHGISIHAFSMDTHGNMREDDDVSVLMAETKGMVLKRFNIDAAYPSEEQGGGGYPVWYDIIEVFRE